MNGRGKVSRENVEPVWGAQIISTGLLGNVKDNGLLVGQPIIRDNQLATGEWGTKLQCGRTDNLGLGGSRVIRRN